MSLEVYTIVGEQGIYHCPKTSKLKLFIVHHACHGGDGRIYLKTNVTTIKKRKKKEPAALDAHISPVVVASRAHSITLGATLVEVAVRLVYLYVSKC